jgi:hypothetical protein
LAAKGTKSTKTLEESLKDVRTNVMICAILPSGGDENAETAYRTKQARALIIYHLRKFAAAINDPIVL